MTEPSPDTEAQHSAAPSGRFRAFAFTGGFDAVVQLGVAHALLVSRGCAPDAVVGVSAGAVNAAALAEILQAGDGAPQAQVDQLRKFLDSYQKVPGEIVRSILPDAFEINALKPLRPIELPIHFKEERADRNSASRSRWGLSYALNKISGLKLTVRLLTLISHCVLEIVAAAELPGFERFRTRAKHLAVFWCLSPFFVALAPLVGPLLIAAVAGSSRRQHGSTAGQLLRHPARNGWQVLRRVLLFLEEIVLFVLWVLSGLAPILVLFSVISALACGLLLLLPLSWSWAAWLAAHWWPLVPALWRQSAVLVYCGLWVALVLFLTLTFIVRPLARLRRAGLRRVLDRILENLALNDGLANTYALKQQLVACFDREYYGKIEIEEVLTQASHRVVDALESNPKHSKRMMRAYRCGTPSIQVGAVVAEVRTGDLSVLAGDVPIIDALLAATAFVPVFPAVEIAPRGQVKGFYIDAGNISREAVGPLVDFIRNEERLDRVAAVDIYPVHRLREESGEPAIDDAPTLIQVALRALQLQRLRDATIEQRLTRLYSRVLPHQAGRVEVAGRPFVNAEVFPLGIATRVSLGHDLLRKSGFDLRSVIYQEVADGCRAALEGMMPEKIETAADRSTWPPAAPSLALPCRVVIRERLGPDHPFLPGSENSPGPGLSEICQHCVLRRPALEDKPQNLSVPTDGRRTWPEWPVLGKAPLDRPAGGRPPIALVPRPGWPVPRNRRSGSARPLISMLFGGGVFRGVFHMGVLNALNELEVVPDLVAGSSVGSIVAAMIAQVFTLPESKLRRAQIARLSATFLAIDKLVLTDRMADFVRGFTVRAGETNFSPQDLDLALRRYDLDESATFVGRLRKVAAGIERLFYFSPARFFKLVESGRSRLYGDLVRQLEEGVQNFLDRSGVGQEILGAEPLALLIRNHVIVPLAEQGCPAGLFSSFVSKGIFFLATTTNLSRGKLDILGAEDCNIQLLEGLLASSAFPAIFRPREGWEVFRKVFNQERYFDGGIMDNLPLDAVAEFLYESAGIARRPRIGGRQVPHLLFTASLEVDKQALPNDHLEVVSRSFRRLRKRAKTFTYNRKIDAFAKVQSDLRTIYEALDADGEAPAWTPLDLHLVAVKPQWLCGTFGFHPMLGFRRRKQAQSIAHGCASTLARLYAEGLRQPAWVTAWDVRGLERIDPKSVLVSPTRVILMPRSKGKTAGECWFRNGVPCPFSPSALEEQSLEKETREQLGRIYESCGKESTHLPV